MWLGASLCVKIHGTQTFYIAQKRSARKMRRQNLQACVSRRALRGENVFDHGNGIRHQDIRETV